ncbi:hypothetical protein C8Q78DRAFT_932240, partial [Trametes maxima]
LPQCTVCWCWRHTYRQCRSPRDICVRCGEGHGVKMHVKVATRCRNRANRDTVPCEHPPVCRNCQGSHRVDEHSLCEFARYRYDSDWYRQHHPSIA